MKEKLKKKKGIARLFVGRKRYVHVGSLLVGIPRIAGVTASRQ